MGIHHIRNWYFNFIDLMLFNDCVSKKENAAEIFLGLHYSLRIYFIGTIGLIGVLFFIGLISESIILGIGILILLILFFLMTGYLKEKIRRKSFWDYILFGATTSSSDSSRSGRSSSGSWGSSSSSSSSGSSWSGGGGSSGGGGASGSW
ncbi:hypothetical protein LEP1GSC024_0626 [Leptospira noguchii str. 2001034031]|uniref:Uncharacterized protein n=1 Tax=Leptospira noguchii str. 2001034031 TaxID=1193053 RepID=M6Y5B1_9LEPT|nr:hypothetical protein LEP1GSC024_0626 [Leptospira noguchii str. 2001034031]